ncbi:MAG: hypothetical protein ACK4Z5_01945 [Brevundimonas sp.]
MTLFERGETRRPNGVSRSAGRVAAAALAVAMVTSTSAFAQTVTPADFNTSITGRLEANGESPTHVFEGQAGDRFGLMLTTVDMGQSFDQAQPMLTIRSPSGRLYSHQVQRAWRRDDATGLPRPAGLSPAVIHLTLPETGQYQVRAGHGGMMSMGPRRPYELRIVPWVPSAPCPEGAGASGLTTDARTFLSGGDLSLGQWVCGNITPDDPREEGRLTDRYTLRLEGGTPLYVTFQTRASSFLSAELIGPDGLRQPLANGDVVTPSRSGPHALIVAGSPEPSLIEDYDLNVEPYTQ